MFLFFAGDIGELEGLRIELEDSRDMLEQEQRSKTQLERKLQELEQILDDQKMDSENIQHTLTAKVGWDNNLVLQYTEPGKWPFNGIFLKIYFACFRLGFSGYWSMRSYI